MSVWSEISLGALVARMRPPPEYALVAQVGDGTGTLRNRTVDLVAFGVWPSRGLTVEAFEIKCNRADWRREKKTPDKAEAVARHCDSFSIVAPPGVVPLEELPIDWGLYESPKEPSATAKLTCVRDPLTRVVVPDVARIFVAAVLQRVTKNVVPVADVARQAKTMADAQVRDRMKDNTELNGLRREVEAYKTQIAAFEKRTGLTIEHAYDLQPAARAIMAAARHGNDPTRLATSLKHHANRIRETLKDFDAVARELTDPTEDE